MKKLYAQGDIILELVEEASPKTGQHIKPDPDGAVVLARGEVTGHRHIFGAGTAVMFRDDGLARDVPADLYVGHIKISGTSADLTHEEHATITLPKGTYRVRRQREFTVEQVRIVAD